MLSLDEREWHYEFDLLWMKLSDFDLFAVTSSWSVFNTVSPYTMVDILLMFPNEFWMKIIMFRFNFHWRFLCLIASKSALVHVIQQHAITWSNFDLWCHMSYDIIRTPGIISLWPSDAIRRQRSWSTLVQVMACCLMAPSCYPNQCLLIKSKAQWNSSEGTSNRWVSARKT